jgi:pimeloyl-ACP methyl ester carboxylesterase
LDLILIPGLLCDPDLWSHQTSHLADIATLHVADVTQEETMVNLAQKVLATAPNRFALAGLSMGGYVAQEIMRQAPERVERLTLLDTSGRADTDEQRERRDQLIEMSRFGKFRGVTDRLLPILIHEERLTDVVLTDRVKRMAEQIGPEAFHRQQKAIMSRSDSRSYFAEYDLPTLILCGRQDALTPVTLHEEMAELIPGAKLAIIEDSGHLSTMERPQAATALLRHWLLYG